MKLIIEKWQDGAIYASRETKKHHKVCQKERKQRGFTKLEPKVLDDECNLSNLQSNSYIVFEIKK